MPSPLVITTTTTGNLFKIYTDDSSVTFSPTVDFNSAGGPGDSFYTFGLSLTTDTYETTDTFDIIKFGGNTVGGYNLVSMHGGTYTYSGTNADGAFINCTHLTSISFAPGFGADASFTSSTSMFQNCTNLTEITFESPCLGSSNAFKASGITTDMFKDCIKLQYVNAFPPLPAFGQAIITRLSEIDGSITNTAISVGAPVGSGLIDIVQNPPAMSVYIGTIDLISEECDPKIQKQIDAEDRNIIIGAAGACAGVLLLGLLL